MQNEEKSLEKKLLEQGFTISETHVPYEGVSVTLNRENVVCSGSGPIYPIALQKAYDAFLNAR